MCSLLFTKAKAICVCVYKVYISKLQLNKFLYSKHACVPVTQKKKKTITSHQKSSVSPSTHYHPCITASHVSFACFEFYVSRIFCVRLLFNMYVEFTHGSAYSSNSLIFVAVQYFITLMHCNLFIHFIIDQHLGCLQFKVIMNSAAMNVCALGFDIHIYISIGDCIKMIYKKYIWPLR